MGSFILNYSSAIDAKEEPSVQNCRFRSARLRRLCILPCLIRMPLCHEYFSDVHIDVLPKVMSLSSLEINLLTNILWCLLNYFAVGINWDKSRNRQTEPVHQNDFLQMPGMCQPH